jgi:hypothetical protein
MAIASIAPAATSARSAATPNVNAAVLPTIAHDKGMTRESRGDYGMFKSHPAVTSVVGQGTAKTGIANAHPRPQ